MSKVTLEQLEKLFNQTETKDGSTFMAEVLQPEGAVPVLHVVMDGREELPVFLTIDDNQILCVCHLWKENEIADGRQSELLGALLDLNISIALSAFSRIGSQYVIYGALSTASLVENIVLEVETLSDNSLEALDFASDYLQ